MPLDRSAYQIGDFITMDGGPAEFTKAGPAGRKPPMSIEDLREVGKCQEELKKIINEMRFKARWAKIDRDLDW